MTILVRGKSLVNSMSHYLIEQVDSAPRIRVRTCTEVVGAHGTDHLEQLTLRDSETGDTETVNAQYLFVFIGAAPLTDWLDGVVARDDRGFVLTGPDLMVEGQLPSGWPLDRPPYHLESERAGRVRGRAMSGQSRPSESRPRSAKVPWRSCSYTATWRNCE